MQAEIIALSVAINELDAHIRALSDTRNRLTAALTQATEQQQPQPFLQPFQWQNLLTVETGDGIPT